MPASDIDAAVREGLRNSANLFARELEAKISSEDKLSSKISDSIVIEGPYQSSEGSSIDILVGGELAPMALAFEFGSGEHATRGPRGTYPIPKEAGGLLAFEWPRVAAELGKPEGTIFVFPRVDHPGVEAVPYVAPTITKTAPEIAKIIGEAIITAFIGDEKVIEIHAK